MHNFVRRLWTVFARFGFSEARIKQALYALLEASRAYNAAPTFFIPAVVLRRHPALITEIAASGAEIGIHGYVHNDYRCLSEEEQYQQTRQAISIFHSLALPFQGFRNPYLGWTEEVLHIFAALGFTYESNEAVIHDVINCEKLLPAQRSGYEKSMALFQAIEPTAYTLRPHFEGALLRIPTSIPDDEILFDRLRITDPMEIGRIWCQVMERVYSYGGIYTLNLHPERGVLCKLSLEALLRYARSRPQAVWIASLRDVAQWWKERSKFRIGISAVGSDCWLVEASCAPRATLIARHLTVNYQSPIVANGREEVICEHRCILQAAKCPCIALSQRTPVSVMDFLYEQGYPGVWSSPGEATNYSLDLDMPEGLGTTRAEQLERRNSLVQKIEQLDAPLLYFGCWPEECRAALAISGDIDSVTIQDFFLRILEVASAKVPYVAVNRELNKGKLA
ncbi:polysaccharide deacetylase family protein [Ktedonosporobacter rubrisoli]|nr:polysaccharide deacetylase family protein [Ktedonosporobacter rubrisoli]